MFSDRRIKVLRIISRLNVGGPTIHVVNLTAGLDPARFDQLLVAGNESPAEGSMLDYVLSHGVRPHVISEMVTAFSLTPRDAKALVKLYSLICRERPDIVHTHTTKAGFLGRLAARLAGVSIIIHTYHGHPLHSYYGPVKNWLLRRMERLLGCFTDRLVTVSEQVKSELVAYGVAAPKKITVIPLGLDLDPFLRSHTQRGKFRREMGLAEDIKLVGIVGRIFPIKNHSLFLESAARVSAQEPDVRFVIVGDGVLRPDLERQVRDLGIADRVLFTGWRRDLPRIYADLDTLIVSSDNEGTPVSAIESMAAGCPVVATRVGGLPDLIADERTGRLVPPRDPRALASVILELVRNPAAARELGQNAMEVVRKRFTETRLIGDMDHLYSQLLEEKAICFSAAKRIAARGSYD
jgi:glycosyltransferase involved in cell wall biosynthesis